jgi:hypothetical protein
MYMNTGKLLVNVNLIAGLALATLFTSGLAAQTAQPAEKTTANMVVTEQTRQGSGTSPITAQDVTVSQGHERDQVTRWVPARGANGGLELYILMDQDSAGMVNTQLGDIRNFIMEQPVSAKVGIAYMQNGIARIAQAPTEDHALAQSASPCHRGRWHQW